MIYKIMLKSLVGRKYIFNVINVTNDTNDTVVTNDTEQMTMGDMMTR